MRQLPVPPDFRIIDLHSIAFARHEDLRVWCRDLNLPTGGGHQELVRPLLHHSRRLDGDADTEFEDVDLDEDETPVGYPASLPLCLIRHWICSPRLSRPRCNGQLIPELKVRYS